MLRQVLIYVGTSAIALLMVSSASFASGVCYRTTINGVVGCSTTGCPYSTQTCTGGWTGGDGCSC